MFLDLATRNRSASLSASERASFRPDDVNGVSRLLQPQARVLELEVFVNLFDEDCDFGHRKMMATE